jgi:hypothetical protein
VAALAEASLSHIWSFPLPEDVAANTVRVEVDGVEVSTGWHFDTAVHAVVFDRLTPGAQVHVTYGLASTCD